MGMIAALASEKEEVSKSAKNSGLGSRAYSVFWNLREDVAR